MRNYNDWSSGEVDELTGYGTVIMSDHAYIHKGLAFTYNVVLDLAVDEVKELMLETPEVEEQRFIHLRPLRIATSASGIEYHMFEGPDTGAATEATIAVWNRNRNATLEYIEPKAKVYSDVVVNNLGKLLETFYIGEGGSRRNSAGGDSSADEEILLRPGTTYLFRFYNDGGMPTRVSFNLFWYEESHKVEPVD